MRNLTATEAIQCTINEKNKVKLANLTQEQKDAFILEKLNSADRKLLNIIEEAGYQYDQTFERIRAELLLGVIVPEKPTLDDYLTMVKPLIELAFECKQQEMNDYEAHFQPQPVKISRS